MGLGRSSNTRRHKEQIRWLEHSQKFKRQPRAHIGLIDKIHLLHETTLSRLGDMAALSNTQKESQSRKLKRQENIFQTKSSNRSLETDLNKMDISDLPSREFKIMVIKMLTEVKTMHEQSENFKEEIKNFKYQTNHGAEEYSNCTEKFNRRVQKQNR